MRQHPIGTGPFKFVEFKPNESIKVVRNPDYWKPGRPYLDGIEYTIIANPSTGNAGLRRRQARLDLPYRDDTAAEGRQGQAPQAVCDVDAWTISAATC